jgi:Squalene-hopene cyclase N-terminal domain
VRAMVMLLATVIVSVTARAQEARPTPAEVGAAVNRGLGFLASDAQAWRNEHKCVSCHHAALVVWSMREAKDRGYEVDQSLLSDLTKWTAESGDGKTGVPRPPGLPKALNTKAVWFALSLGNPGADSASAPGRKLLVKTMVADQTENGSWVSWPETRPPIFGNSDESMTALAALALIPVAAAGDNAARSARDRGVAWLAKSKTDDDPQSIAMRLVLWQRLERPAEESKPLVHRILERQHADGGWSQAPELVSDAWATGQALYALAHAGFKPDDLVIARAHAFLIKTQRSDGSWPMTSRPVKPGGKGSTSLIPITGAGSAWAVIGLVKSGERLKNHRALKG